MKIFLHIPIVISVIMFLTTRTIGHFEIASTSTNK